jgi:hypothetical protein
MLPLPVIQYMIASGKTLIIRSNESITFNKFVTLKKNKMKKLYFNLTILSAIGMLLFFSCSKESEQKDTGQQKVFQPSEQDVLIEGKILAFKQKLEYTRENPNLKSGEADLTIEEAVWNIEALVNYTYADASAEYETLINDQINITVNLSDSKVAFYDAVNTYDNIVDSIAVKFNQIQSEEKYLIVVDVSVIETDGETVTFGIDPGIGTDGPPGWFNDFGPTDYWFYGQLDGKCDQYIGQGIGSDAAEQIQFKVNMRRSLPEGHSYFIDIKNVYCNPWSEEITFEQTLQCECCDLLNPNDPNPGDNINDYLLFLNYGYPGINNFHDCIPPNEMNFYLGGLEEIVYNIAYDCFSQQLSGKIFVRCDMDWDLIPAGEEYWILHNVNIQYGISVGSGGPPPR